MKQLVVILILLSLAHPSFGDSLWVNSGKGSQVNAPHENTTYGIDYTFSTVPITRHFSAQFGLSYTHLKSNTETNSIVNAYTVYPQFLYKFSQGCLMGCLFNKPFIFIRIPGITYIDNRMLGEREQGKNFTFQDQIGFGLHLGHKQTWSINYSFKHFSNGLLWSPNESFDVPVVLTIGYQWK